MESLNTQLAAVDAAEQEKQADAKGKASETYWTLVERADNPKTGDLDKLSAALKTLGLTRPDLDFDAGLVRKIAKLDAQAAKQGELNQALSEANRAKQEALRAEPERIQAIKDETNALKQADREAASRYDRALAAERESGDLGRELMARKQATAPGPTAEPVGGDEAL